MRIRTVKNVLMGVALVMVAAAPAAAQANIGLGLSVLHDGNASQNAVGIAVDASKDVIKSTDKFGIGVVGDFGLNKFDGCSEKSFGGGVRVTGKSNPKIKPFGQFLIGGVKCGEGSNLMLQPGFGVDFKLTEMLNARVQLDFRRIQYDGFSGNEQRFVFGVVLPIGNK